MRTPICDFVNRYAASDALRLHMPGHKGFPLTGMEELDITEISGADDLFHASGIIAESERALSDLFGTADSFYSTEGSSLCIRAMLLMAMQYANQHGRQAKFLAGRNAHKAFITAAALLDFDYCWIEGDEASSYLSCRIQPAALEAMLEREKPIAVYLTSPDYLGNTADITAVSALCKRHGCLLLVDNAHGAYLKFLPHSRHPIDLGADLVCDSAHKTLPALTGAAYLHIAKSAPAVLTALAKPAMSVFASTSPSYLILQSLDRVNAYLASGFCEKLARFLPKVARLKETLVKLGYALIGDEPMKITVSSKPCGYSGKALARLLEKQGLVCEFADRDFVVLMLSCEFSDAVLRRIEDAFASIPKHAPLSVSPERLRLPKRVMHAREALFASRESVCVADGLGRIFASTNIACPPAVPIVVCGEIIDESALRMFRYYGVSRCEVVINENKIESEAAT